MGKGQIAFYSPEELVYVIWAVFISPFNAYYMEIALVLW